MNVGVLFTAVSVCCLLAGCNQRSPEAVRPDPTPQAQQTPEVGRMSGFSTAEEPLPTVMPSPPEPIGEAENKVSLFENPQTNQAALDYVKAFGDIKSFQSAPLGDPVANPESVTAGLNELGARLDRLNSARQRVESGLNQGEKKRWKSLLKQMDKGDSED